MKKLLIILCLIFLALPVFANIPINILQDINVKNNNILSKENESEYKKDLERVLKHISYDKIASAYSTNKKRTLKELLMYMDKIATSMYKEYLSGKIYENDTAEYIKTFNDFLGTISLYSDVIAEEMASFIEKYNITEINFNIDSNNNFYEYYIKDYNIKYSNEFKELLILKQQVFDKIFKYQIMIDPNYKGLKKVLLGK